MNRWTRRDLLRAGATGALAAPWLAGCAHLVGAETDGTVFAHGVASGDPLADRVVLWTRLTPSAQAFGTPATTFWQIARDPELDDVIASGRAETGPERDYTVKVDVQGLEPGGVYYYRFESQGTASVIGRTRTLPRVGVERVRLGFACCANLPQGFFNAYRMLARRSDLDAVVHLGDYLYEYANGVYGDGAALGRLPQPLHEIVRLADYRMRHAQYKRDADLQELHRQHPVIAVWDDHELANDAWRGGAENHSESASQGEGEGEGEWAARRAAAVRAYREWLPIRDVAAARTDDIYRAFRFGDLAELVMLDTRLVGRDQQGPPDDLEQLADPARSLLGRDQEAWLGQRLDDSQRDRVAWRVLGQQVVLSPLSLPGRSVNPDAWDGYPTARARLLDQLERSRIDDVIVLSGDIHSSWALDVAREPFDSRRYDPASGRGALAVEFVAPAVSSSTLGSFPRARELFADAPATHPHLRFVDMDHNGYAVLDLDRDRAQAEWYFVDGVETRGDGESFAHAFATPRGISRLEPVDAPAAPAAAPGPAPS